MADERLESWKEIANYLARDVRTVQRWERQEGLPVRRHRHQKQATVYALKPELDAWREHRKPEPPRRPWWRKALAVTAIAVVGLTIGYVRRNVEPPRRETLAVLPLVNLSGDARHDYLSDGLTDELITRIGKLSPDRLGVIAWGSVQSFKHDPRPIDRAVDELGVDFVLEGSVRRDDDRVRINAKLVRASDRTHVWAETYEEPIGDLLSLERDIARSIARGIELTLAAGVEDALSRTKHVDPVAYDHYLRGLVAGNGLDGTVSKSHFEAAIAEDPTFADAHAWLAISLNKAAFRGFAPMQEATEAAHRAARRALELDPNVAEAHVALGLSAFLFDWDWSTSERELQRALELDPNSSWAHWARGWQLTGLRRHEEAIAAMQRARSLDPLNPYINDCVGEMYWFARRYDEAEDEWLRVAERHPDYLRTELLFHLMYEEMGRYEDAILHYERRNAARNRDPEIAGSLRRAYEIDGEAGYWSWWLERLRASERQRPRDRPHAYVMIHAKLRNWDRAFEFLERAHETRNGHMPFLLGKPFLDPVRNDPRLVEIVERMDFPVS